MPDPHTDRHRGDRVLVAGRADGAARTFDLATATIADRNAAFEAGALNSERLTGPYLARIAASDRDTL